MVRKVFLHVGLPKSGTTYVQAVASRNKAGLAERAGLLFPGETWKDQVHAVRDLRELKVARGRRTRTVGAWDRLVAEMRAWPGDALVSMEWLCKATAPQIERIRADLADSEVHVVFTVRDVSRTVPAAWQESTQNGAAWRWSEFLEQATSPQSRTTQAGAGFWEKQDMGPLLQRWSALAPRERIHVVTVPHPGAEPRELWRRTAAALGIDPEGYDVSDLRANTSLGMESAELMRRVNEQVRPRVGRISYEYAFKYDLAKRRLAARKGQESRVELPPKYHGWAVDVAEQQVRAIEAAGVQVHGSLDDLRPSPAALAAAQDDAEPDLEGVLDAAVDALAAIALARHELQDEHKALEARTSAQRSRLRRQSEELTRLRAEREQRARRPLRQALVDASASRPLLHRARVGYWKAVGAGRRLRRSA
jgi:hypothetical protein